MVEQGQLNHKFGLLLNPASGKIKKRIAPVRKSISTIPGITIREASIPSEFYSVLDSFFAMEISHLAIIGGDGTAQSVLSYCLENLAASELPRFIVLPGGTTNMTATDIGINSINTGLDILKAIVNGTGHWQTINKPLVKLETSDGQIKYGFFFGTGVIASGVNYFNLRVKKSGMTGEISSAIAATPYLLKLFLSPRDQELRQPITRINIDDDCREDIEATLFFATTLDRLLFGLKPYWGLSTSPLHITLIESTAKRLWRSLLKILRNQGKLLNDKDGYFSKDSSNIYLDFTGYYIIDGEIFHLQEQNSIKMSASMPVTFIVP